MRFIRFMSLLLELRRSLGRDRRAGAEHRDRLAFAGHRDRGEPGRLLDDEAERAPHLDALNEDLAALAYDASDRGRAVLAACLGRRQNLVGEVHLDEQRDIQDPGGILLAVAIRAADRRVDRCTEESLLASEIVRARAPREGEEPCGHCRNPKTVSHVSPFPWPRRTAAPSGVYFFSGFGPGVAGGANDWSEPSGLRGSGPQMYASPVRPSTRTVSAPSRTASTR